ncbi:hypothetical protein PR003_g11353 [Phytophthora rubi]|uniref:RxLR effector protein n=1 Tax=Phytophthora rubi TaxID=129364 RepID=A0A6A3MVG2_9STRA|nr:hypothetical protein PR002_g10951 [Phytophthora rubi]KAE9031873.1 hypothetical protein PR001_g10864 [Phytophthora rubi]KAE9338724.1 hypothetical protein PR003_g11353 [Phytophthora rubi]
MSVPLQLILLNLALCFCDKLAARITTVHCTLLKSTTVLTVISLTSKLVCVQN